MSAKLRPAAEVSNDMEGCIDAWDWDWNRSRAVAITEADRAAVRRALVEEIAEWVEEVEFWDQKELVAAIHARFGNGGTQKRPPIPKDQGANA